MLTEKDYCDYDTCVALKELGYPLTSKKVTYEDKSVFVPSLSLYEAHKFLRKQRGVYVQIRIGFDDFQYLIYRSHYYPISNEVFYPSYEEAYLEGIKAAVKILKEK